MQETRIGTVQSLYRYPVKSMLGERRRVVALFAGGVRGDRAVALVDTETGKIVTAKQPVLWKAMLTLTARRHQDGPTVVVFPDGRVLDITAAGAGRELSDYLGREVSVSFARPELIEMERADPDQVIARGSATAVEFEILPVAAGAPEGAFVDYAPVHLIATSSLRAGGRRAAAGVAEPQRFRPNIVVDTPGLDAFCENDWIGGVLKIGGSVTLNVVLSTPRCAVPTLQHGAVPADRTALACVTENNKRPFLDKGALPSLGVYAEVFSAGDIACGDEVFFIVGGAASA